MYDLKEISIINAYVLMTEYMKANPGRIKRRTGYAQVEFRERLVRQLGGLEQTGQPPLPRAGVAAEPDLHVEHLPVSVDHKSRGNCHLCYARTKKEKKVKTHCSTCRNGKDKPMFFCISSKKQCFRDFHA